MAFISGSSDKRQFFKRAALTQQLESTLTKAMRYNINKSYSSTSSSKFNYGSFYFPESCGSNRVHSGYPTHKSSSGSGGVSFGKSNKYHHSKSSHHERCHSPIRNQLKSSSPLGSLEYKEKKSSSLSAGQSHGLTHDTKSYGSHSKDYGSWKTKGLLNTNEKETMQYLNERLASYLDKVRSLEQENAQLEKKICEWYENNTPTSLPDASLYLKTIEELQKQISTSTVETAKTALEVDNAKWATDDFKNKYNIEVGMRSNVDADVKGLRRMLEGLNKEKCDLDMQVQELGEELQQMKKNHEEEVNSLRGQLGARVNVELDTAPALDLNEVLSEIREEYENLMAKNLRDVEAMYLARSEELSHQVQSSSDNLQSVEIEKIDLMRSVQNLEIDLESQLNMRSALQSNLTETEANYSSELAQLQNMIDNVQAELAQIRCDLERQNAEYRSLMDQKNLLEMEIATYKRLLEEQDNVIQETPMTAFCLPEDSHSPTPLPDDEKPTCDSSC
ncbi:keratin, type I cuticular Ha4-like [Leptodactylus fuscus]|uniref:keratin, type I cuticular Ha4-like n=1 Tax=Leptodactylus fuscus TaxID=238119 RepID=UPI003F4EAFC4